MDGLDTQYPVCFKTVFDVHSFVICYCSSHAFVNLWMVLCSLIHCWSRDFVSSVYCIYYVSFDCRELLLKMDPCYTIHLVMAILLKLPITHIILIFLELWLDLMVSFLVNDPITSALPISTRFLPVITNLQCTPDPRSQNQFLQVMQMQIALLEVLHLISWLKRMVRKGLFILVVLGLRISGQ